MNDTTLAINDAPAAAPALRDGATLELGFSPAGRLWSTVSGIGFFVGLLVGLVALLAGSVYYLILPPDRELANIVMTVVVAAMVVPSMGALIWVIGIALRAAAATVGRRVQVSARGVALDAFGAERYAWTEIERFEVGDVSIDAAGNATATALMRLRDGRIVQLPALSRDLGRRHVRQLTAIRERVVRLEELRRLAAAQTAQ